MDNLFGNLANGPKRIEFGYQNIIDGLFTLSLKTRFAHHNTTSYSKHKALDETYESIDDLLDEIVEKIIGCTSKRYERINIGIISGFTEQMPFQIADEIKSFSSKLKSWAEEYGYLDVAQLSDSLWGTGAKLLYLLSLS